MDVYDNRNLCVHTSPGETSPGDCFYFGFLDTSRCLWQYGNMIRKGIVVLLWFPLTFLLLIVNLTLLAKTTQPASATNSVSKIATVDDTRKITATTDSSQVLGYSVVAGDARSLLLERFLKRYESPMAPFADLIVKEADVNYLDFRLVVAIAMCESNLGKKMPLKDSYNAWGIAVYTGTKTGKEFDSWPHAISWVSRYIKETYLDKGITDLKDIGAIWAPPSIENGYSWTNCVEKFQQTIL